VSPELPSVVRRVLLALQHFSPEGRLLASFATRLRQVLESEGRPVQVSYSDDTSMELLKTRKGGFDITPESGNFELPRLPACGIQ